MGSEYGCMSVAIFFLWLHTLVLQVIHLIRIQSDEIGGSSAVTLRRSTILIGLVASHRENDMILLAASNVA